MYLLLTQLPRFRSQLIQFHVCLGEGQTQFAVATAIVWDLVFRGSCLEIVVFSCVFFHGGNRSSCLGDGMELEFWCIFCILRSFKDLDDDDSGKLDPNEVGPGRFCRAIWRYTGWNLAEEWVFNRCFMTMQDFHPHLFC